jgi:plasmid stability protein
MKSLHIRDVDEQVLERLRQLARFHNRSLQGEVRAILQDASQRAPMEHTSSLPELIRVEAGTSGTWAREEIYGDEGR